VELSNPGESARANTGDLVEITIEKLLGEYRVLDKNQCRKNTRKRKGCSNYKGTSGAKLALGLVGKKGEAGAFTHQKRQWSSNRAGRTGKKGMLKRSRRTAWTRPITTMVQRRKRTNVSDRSESPNT